MSGYEKHRREGISLADDPRYDRRSSATHFGADFPGLRTIDHIAWIGPERAAWFRDSEGNIPLDQRLLAGPACSSALTRTAPLWMASE